MEFRIDVLLVVLLCLTVTSSASNCDRTPERVQKHKNINDIDKFVIEVSGNPTRYVPGENYTISLKANPKWPTKPRFTEFNLVVEREGASEYSPYESYTTGSFHLLDPMLTRVSIKCRNTVIQTNTLFKSEIRVSWVAPPPGSGCLFIRATVVESADNWFQDDGSLTRRLCEETSENQDIPPKVLKHCCACDEAKYEVAFQGMWSRNTHPKDYPSDVWTTKFGEMVGASHKIHKSFWNYGDMASDGLKILAEDGDTKPLETELKEMSDDIRTIIIMRELSYPNITGTSYTVFRVDRDNHLMSLVSKITPSPDWIVGVSNLELCLRNCSWVESRVLNLYPWDIGTDDGISYESSNSGASLRNPIRMIKSNSPNDERSPFYSEDGEPIKPLAKLHVTRQKTYEKNNCNSGEISSEDDAVVDENCATSGWKDWSPCTDNCIQFRQRSFLNPERASYCRQKLVQQRSCTDCEQVEDNENRVEGNPQCKLTEWSEWSSCSNPCGKGTKTRDREFVNPEYHGSCTSYSLTLQENEECEGPGEDCENYVEPPEGECSNASWGDWTPCNVTCGQGFKFRYLAADKTEANEEEDAVVCPTMDIVQCYKPACEDSEDNNQHLYGGINSGSHVGTTPVVVWEGSENAVVDCKVTNWSPWTPCNATEPCKKGFKFQHRTIKIHAQNGGSGCPKKLLRKRRCKAPCPQHEDDFAATAPTWGSGQPNESVKVDCEMGPWSAWSPCSTICGGSAVRQRTRSILVYPKNDGKPCEHRLEQKKCPLPLACSDRKFNTYNY